MGRPLMSETLKDSVLVLATSLHNFAQQNDAPHGCNVLSFFEANWDRLISEQKLTKTFEADQ